MSAVPAVPEELWRRVATEVNSRMLALDLEQRRLAELAETSPQVVRDLQRGNPKRYRPATLARIAEALGWPPNAFVRLLSGLPPVEAQDLPTGGDRDRRVDELVEQIHALELALDEVRRELQELRDAG